MYLYRCHFYFTLVFFLFCFMKDFSPALVTFEAHQKFFTDVYLEGHTFLVKYMWPSFLMSLASTVDIQDYCFSRASRLSNRWFTFFSCCIFTMLESSQTHLQMWDGRRQDTASVLLLSLLYTSFFFFFLLILYAITQSLLPKRGYSTDRA